jgi:hypothetical protein
MLLCTLAILVDQKITTKWCVVRVVCVPFRMVWCMLNTATLIPRLPTTHHQPHTYTHTHIHHRFIIIPIYVVRTGVINCTYPLEESVLMDHVPKSTRGRYARMFKWIHGLQIDRRMKRLNLQSLS